MLVAPLAGKARQAVHLAERRINVYEGSVRSGKTVASLLAWLRFVRQGPAGNLVMVGRTERTLKRNVIDPLVEMLGPARARHVRGEGELHLLGRRVYLAGANDDRAQDRIAGLTLAGAYVDEATLVPEGFWSMLLTRLSVEGARCFATANPDHPGHWLKAGYLDRAAVWLRGDGQLEQHQGDQDRLDLARVSFRLDDNPHLPAAYRAALEAEFSGLWYRRYVAGEWVQAEGAVYSMFDPELHVVDELPVDDGGRTDVDRWVVAIDYGTVAPFAALLVGVSEHHRMVFVAAEWRHDSRAARRQLTDAEYSTRLREWLAVETGRPDGAALIDALVVDPSASSFIAQLWRDGWPHVRHADNTVADGIRDVASLLAAGRLKIHRSCTGLLGELPGYTWDPKPGRDGKERPRKADDHSADALRYGARGLRRWWRHWLTAPIADLDEAEAA